MITLLDCIYRVPCIINDIIEKRKTTMLPLIKAINEEKRVINEIIFIGSGTSNTCSVTSCRFVEKASGISSTTMLPNEFLSKVSYNPNGMYVFTSQSGTSTLTQAAQKKMNELDYLTVAITESNITPLAKEAKVFLNMGCGKEEYGMRTIGYCASVLTQMLMGLEIGLARGALTEEKYDEYIKEALRVPISHKEICDATLSWFDRNRWSLMNMDSFVLYGSGSLWGVAQEGALKILEIAKRFLCVGYEMDDGLHGPTLGFTAKHGIIILSDGEKDNKLAMGLAKYIKNEVGSAFIIGENTLDEKDFSFTPKGGAFKCLEYAPVVEILAYRLAIDYGIVLKDLTNKEPLTEMKYFNTHDE